MPQFALDMDKGLSKMLDGIGDKLDDIAPKMLEEATPIVRNSARQRARRSSVQHKHMADHIEATKPKKTKDGSWVANITIKEKREDGERLMEVAAVNEYGTSKMSPRPFLRPTIEATKTEVNEKMKQVFNREMGK